MQWKRSRLVPRVVIRKVKKDISLGQHSNSPQRKSALLRSSESAWNPSFSASTYRFFFLMLFINLFFWLCQIFIAVCELSLIVGWGLLVWGHRLQAHRLSSCGTQAWLPWGVWDLSSLARGWTRVPCIARQILNYRTIIEARLPHLFFISFLERKDMQIWAKSFFFRIILRVKSLNAMFFNLLSGAISVSRTGNSVS